MKNKRTISFSICFFFFLLQNFLSVNLFADETVSTSLGGQTSPGTPCPGDQNVQLYDFSMSAFSGSPSFTSISNFTTSGTYVASDITGFTLYVTNFSAFNTTTPLQTIAAAGPGTHTFNFAYTLPLTARFFWITTNFTAGAVTGHTITVNLITAGMYVVSPVLNYGTNTAGGQQTICNTAPVGLISFIGTNDGEKNILNWTTASETNNDFFTLEKTVNGYDYSVVVTVDGAGNSVLPIHYSVTDEIQHSSEITYYRLKQTDYNGDFEYVGGIVALRNKPMDGIYFNFNAELTGITVGNLPGDTPYSIYNSLGQLLSSGVLSTTENEVDVSSFSSGFYVLRLEDANGTTKTFSK